MTIGVLPLQSNSPVKMDVDDDDCYTRLHNIFGIHHFHKIHKRIHVIIIIFPANLKIP